MLADARAKTDDLGLGISGAVDHHVAEFLGKADEVTLGIDHHLLDDRRALFEQAAQQVRLAGPGIALHQQAGREKFLDVDVDRLALRGLADHDVGAHGCLLAKAGGGAQGGRLRFP